MNEFDQTLRQDALKPSSATRIQSAVRNHNATKKAIQKAREKINTQQTTQTSKKYIR
jgi:hypothetical protein